MPDQVPLPPAVYEFWSTADQRCLYTGKASRNPGDRIKAHYDARKPWALQADIIRINWLHGVGPNGLDMAEQTRIRQLRPRGNRQHNTAHYDRTWALKVQRDTLIRTGERVPFWWSARLAVAWAREVATRCLRAVAVTIAVDIVLLVVWKCYADAWAWSLLGFR